MFLELFPPRRSDIANGALVCEVRNFLEQREGRRRPFNGWPWEAAVVNSGSYAMWRERGCTKYGGS